MEIGLSEIFMIIFTGVASGFGTAVGSYLATNHVIEKTKKMLRKAKKGK